jgi:hypothetical protein
MNSPHSVVTYIEAVACYGKRQDGVSYRNVSK